jgi:signal peptidase I
LFYWVQALVFALIVLIVINIFVGHISGVVGDSMNNTLVNGEKVLVQIAGYNEPKRGDIVVIYSEAFPDELLIKRVIGVEGDVIDFDMQSGQLIINGKTVYEPYIAEYMVVFGSLDYPYTVPEGCVFVMGDNRNHSTDSRSAAIGAIPAEQIIGKAFFRIWPLSSWGKI